MALCNSCPPPEEIYNITIPLDYASGMPDHTFGEAMQGPFEVNIFFAIDQVHAIREKDSDYVIAVTPYLSWNDAR